MDSNSQLTSAAISDRGLSEKRPQNEDSFVELPQIGLFAVADGVGGAQAGEVASQMAMEVLAEAFANAGRSSDAAQVMRSAIEAANSAVYQMARDIPQLSSMATTIVALHVSGDNATIAHVGDSRLYSFAPNGEIKRETDDHSMVADEVRAGRMTEQQAENHPSKNIINRALGADAAVDIDLRSFSVTPGTTFILCSDGITRHISDAELSTVLQREKDLDSVCSRFKELCFSRGAEDNLTAVAVKVGEAESDAPRNVLDLEEPTAAGRRSPFESLAKDDEPLLELEYNSEAESMPSDTVEEHPQTPGFPAEVLAENAYLEKELANANSTPADAQEEASSLDNDVSSARDIKIDTVTPNEPDDRTDFSLFGESGNETNVANGSSGLATAVAAIALLLAGAVSGALGYQYFIERNSTASGPVLTEMRSANIPQSAFEENRRNVDKDPAGYAARFGSNPQDSEDYYLLGRAYLLSGDYVRARSSLTEARARLAGADPANARILSSDIAMALALTNDTTIQAMLRNELGGPSSTGASPSPTSSPIANSAP
jgi:serine/threonine protein phosphatase PrpC/cytochrome c-type biogenesis protein CcmH/NrfG